MPSAFIAATASPRALKRCADSTCRGSSSVASSTDSTSSAYVGDSRSSSSSAASANGDSGWLSAKFGCRSTVSATVRPSGVGRVDALARRRRRAARGRSRSRAGCAQLRRPAARGCRRAACRIAANASPGRAITLSSIACVDPEAGASAAPARRRPAARTSARPRTRSPRAPSCARSCALLRVVAGLGRSRCVLDLVVGRLHDDRAGGVEAGPPGAPGDLVELAGVEVPHPRRRRTCDSAVSSTVRIGTLMPTPRVSVPQMTLSSPAWASVSTSRR